MYAMVTDNTDWWIVGDEGRANEQIMTCREDARSYAEGMAADGRDINTQCYYVDRHDGTGPDWDDPQPFHDED